jgi:putative PIN family toxin of toxin-antitoxin system
VKVFFDTNVLVAAYATHGACNELLNHCIARHTIYTSDFVLGELEEKLLRKIKLTGEETLLIIQFLRRNSIIAQEVPLAQHVARDHDDDHILAAAISEPVACIVTGDKDLLALRKIREIPIVTPADFWKLELRENIAQPDGDS